MPATGFENSSTRAAFIGGCTFWSGMSDLVTMSTLTCGFCANEYAAGLAACPSCGAGASIEFPLPMGTELQGGKYTVGKVLGRGGFGITYKGAHKGLKRPVAIKELFPEFATRSGLRVTLSPTRQQGFRREQDSVVQEARVIANLNSSNIVDVHDFFHENGTVYIVMEYLEGPTLEQDIERRGKVEAADVVRVAEEICNALETMHATNVLHRDVKPANILLARDGRVVLIDFGSAREFESNKTQHHTRVLSMNYGAPEQFSQTARFGPYTDLYGLGATLYHALTGTPLPTAMDRLQSANETVRLPSTAPAGLLRAVQEALSFRVEDRPQSVEEFRVLLGSKNPRTVPRPKMLANRTAAAEPPADGVPYEFKGKQYHSPADLAAALSRDWDTAIQEWNAGYIRKWMTRGVVGGSFERELDGIEADPLFALDQGHNGTSAVVRAISVSNNETAVQERRLMRVFCIMDPGWKPSYRGMPLQDKKTIGAWCQTNNDAQYWVHRCLTHGILLAHPKKFARALHDRTFQEYRVYSAHIHHRLDEGDYDFDAHSVEYVMYQVFAILVGAQTTKASILQALQDEQAMKVGWFSDLTGQAPDSAGCALALQVLAPKAHQERTRRTFKIWVWIILGVLALFMCGIVNAGF